jgi:hypothetical protein
LRLDSSAGFFVAAKGKQAEVAEVACLPKRIILRLSVFTGKGRLDLSGNYGTLSGSVRAGEASHQSPITNECSTYEISLLLPT